MSDPLRPFSRWLEQHGIAPFDGSETEQIEHRDRVSYAAETIRNYELRLWFERDWHIASLIAKRCPECMVYSIPQAAFWIDDLDSPPPWRRRRSENGEV